ncbi:MAG: ABC transporter substrate-binding protein [Gammaproteobacteria bacterium]|nr:ABC transporter substrate-binding protein [Gammaproteobacteria bacterium]
MERNSTTSKDLIQYGIFSVIILMLILAMYMVDRQWQKMAEMQRVMQEQAGDIRSLRGLIRSLDQRVRSGVSLADGTSASEEIPEAFERAHASTRLPGYQEGDWLVQALGNSLKTLSPIVSTDAYASDIQEYVLESLLTRDPETLEYVGLLARSWTTSKNGLTFTFSLRRDVKFSDGQPLTAEDVVFSYDMVMNPRIDAPGLRAYLQKIESVKAIDEYTVVFKLKEPYFNSLSLVGSMKILPKHFYQSYVANPESYNQSKGLLMGSGPYRLSDPKGWTPDAGVVELERNPRYWGPITPSFDRIVWKVIQNDSARLTTFRNSDIDLYGARPREYQDLLQDQELMARTRHLEYMNPVASYSYLGWNQKRNEKQTLFADKRVRQAMTYLTDRESVIEEINLGYAEIAVSPFNPRSKQHNPNITPRPYDLDKARKLLAKAGFMDRDGNGVLENEAGQPFEFELVFFQGSEDSKRMVLYLKDLYARAGIKLKPKPSEWPVMLDLIKRRDFDAITLAWTSTVETDIYQMLHSDQIDDNGDNFVNYSNPELDKIIEQARSTVDEEKRMPLWRKAEAILYEDQPYTFMMRRKSLLFADRRLHNLEVTRLGLNITPPMEWYVPAEMHKYTR